MPIIFVCDRCGAASNTKPEYHRGTVFYEVPKHIEVLCKKCQVYIHDRHKLASEAARDAAQKVLEGLWDQSKEAATK